MRPLPRTAARTAAALSLTALAAGSAAALAAPAAAAPPLTEQQALVALADALPAGYDLDTCTTLARDSRELAAVTCGATDTNPAAVYYLYPNTTAMYADVDEVLAALDEVTCPDGTPTGPWHRLADPDTQAGVASCLSDGEDDYFVWTDDATLLLGALATDSLDDTYEWWSGADL